MNQQIANNTYAFLIMTNIITLVFLVIISFRYRVPQKVLKKLGIIDLHVLKIYPLYSINNIISLTYDRDNFDIVMVGDSITNAGRWNEIFNNRKVANLGINGDSTDGVLNRLVDIYYLNPKKCFLMIGINDFQGNRSIEYVIQNYKRIIQELKQHNIKIIVQSILHLGHNYYINHIGGKNKTNWKTINKKVEKTNIELEKIAVEYGVEFIDINTKLSVNNVLEEKYGDSSGLHLSQLGYEEWAEIIKPLIE
ncbi:GDSL-type esterase/lipase family protein [Treponema primitia]|uniref:GDSL-type esterase/lipase family protein n=1 Tax=Treponema primitia TaxID=88058 RepID=UPI0009DAAF6C|nr:GDSL-type esterase/lipase family protein [Treponema primitia]